MKMSVGRLKWLAIPVTLVALYAILGFYAVPHYAARALRDYATGTLHRDATVGAIRFNPFTLDAEIRDLSIADTDHKPMVGFSRLHVRAGLWASLLRRGYVVSLFELDDLSVNAIRRPDQSINLAALVPPAGAKPAAPPPAGPAPLPRVFVDSFALKNAALGIDDEARVQALHLMLRPVSFELKDFRTTSESNSYGFSARSTRGESLDWHGTFGLAPIESTGNFALGHILATTISQVGLDLLPLDITKGEIDLSGTYHFVDAGAGPQVDLDVPTIRVRDLGLRARGEHDDWVTVPEIAIDGSRLDLAKQTVTVAAVKVARPQVTAWLERDGSLNLAKLYSTKAAASEAAPTDRISKPWTVRAPLLQIAGLDVHFEDRKPEKPVAVHLNPVDVTVRDFALPLAAPIALDAKLGVNDTGTVHLSGPVGLNPVTARLAVDLHSLDLPFLQPYIDGFAKLDLLKGSLGGQLNVAYAAAASAGHSTPVTVTGDVSVRTLHTQDKLLHLDFVNWNLLALKGIEVRSEPFSLSIHEVIANQPYARVVIAADQTININEVLGIKPAPADDAAAASAPPQDARAKSPAPAAAATAKPAAKPPAKDQPVAVHLVRIEDGSMNFADMSVRPNFATGIQGLSGTIKGLSGKTGTRADVDLTGKVDRYAPVTIAGKINPLSADSYTDIKFGFRNLELTTFSPYSGKFAGYRVEKGKMSVEFSYHIENRQLDAKHHVILDQLELGEKVDSPDATGLPVKFAISLLKDSNGVIDLDVPVGGSIDDPHFKLSKVIWRVVVNLIEKAVTAPFKLLGKLFGGHEPPEQISFVPGSATLDQAALDQIGLLKQGLVARPGLKLDVPMASCADSDGDALAAGAWQTHVRALASARLAGRKGGKTPSDDAVEAFIADPKLYRKLLEDAYRSEHGAAAVIPAPAPDADADEAAVDWLEKALKPSATPAPGAVVALGKARAEAVERALLDGSGIDPGRVFVITDKATECQDPAFVQMKLGLK